MRALGRKSKGGRYLCSARGFRVQGHEGSALTARQSFSLNCWRCFMPAARRKSVSGDLRDDASKLPIYR